MTITLGMLSYGIAAVGFLILTLLLAISWEGRTQGFRLVAACAVTAVWAGVLAVGSGFTVIPVQFILVAEFLRYGAWFVVLTGLTRGVGLGQRLGQAAHLVWIASVVSLVATPALEGLGISLPDPAGLLGHAGLVLSLLALVLLEQIYRNTREGGRFALKLFVIAAGLMFAYDLFLYSQAQLTNRIDPVTWDARGFVILLMVPMIAIAARRNPQWSLNVFVSRHVVFYTTSFMVIGGLPAADGRLAAT